MLIGDKVLSSVALASKHFEASRELLVDIDVFLQQCRQASCFTVNGLPIQRRVTSAHRHQFKAVGHSGEQIGPDSGLPVVRHESST